MEENKGIIVTSSRSGAGKSLVCAGISGAILEEGLKVAPVKPLEYHEASNDTTYFTTVTKLPVFYDTILLDDWVKTNRRNWVQLVNVCKSFTLPVLCEAPGCVATPLRADDQIYDSVDLSKILDWPLLLVIDADQNLFEEAVKAISFIRHKDCTTIGFIVTCPKEDTRLDRVENIANTIALNYSIPCLGIYPFSPSIDVKNNMQGNVIKLTQKHIDIYPVQKNLNILVM
jgi:cobyrinic acid a,c-diamide synthase